MWTIPRNFDDGAPMVLQDEHRPDGSCQGLVITSSICTNAACACTDMDLDVRRIEWLPGDTSRVAPEVVLRAVLDLQSGSISMHPGRSDPAALDLLRRLLRPDLLDVLRGRWQRARVRRSDEWRGADLTLGDLQDMVPFDRLFPSAWDLRLPGGYVWAHDCWCLNPRCTCDSMVLELHPEGALLGAARIDLRLFTVEPASGPAGPVCKLAEGAIRDPDFRRQLLERRRVIRQVVRELPELLPAGPPPIVGGPKVERNAPCPCGSGKKYKRCCGR